MTLLPLILWLPVCAALLMANQAVSSVRFWILCRSLAIDLPPRSAHDVNIRSLAGAALFFNFFGQSMTRAYLLRARRLDAGAMFMVTALERGLAFAILAIMVVVLVAAHFGLEAVSGFTVPGLIATLLGLGLAATAAYLSLTKSGRRAASMVLSANLLLGLAAGALVTLVMHGLMLAAYMVVASAALDAPISVSLALAGALTMIGASVPVAPGGWGAREATSAAAFSLVGADILGGVTIGVVIGATALAALAANYALTRLGPAPPSLARSAPPRAAGRLAAARCLRALIWMGPAAVGFLLAFQVRLPLGDGGVTATLSDPLAIVIGMTTVAVFGRRIVTGVGGVTLWRAPEFPIALALTGAVIALAFAHGVWRFGVTDWALINRFIGAGVALSLLLSGAMMTSLGGESGLRRGIRIAASAASAIVALEILAHGSGLAALSGLQTWTSPIFHGFLQNRNAWAFILCALIGALAPIARSPRDLWLLSALTIGAVATGSRTAFIALPLLFCVALLLGRIDAWRFVPRVAALGAAVALVLSVGPGAVEWFLTSIASDGAPVTAPRPFNIVDHIRPFDYIQSDRIESLIGGWRMFLSAPVFGAGLGAFMHQQITETGVPLVIHNTALWLLAEFGLVGAALFAAPFIVLLRALALSPELRANRAGSGLILVLLVFVVFSMTHEMAFQRAFWFLAGALAATPGAGRRLLKDLAAPETPPMRSSANAAFRT